MKNYILLFCLFLLGSPFVLHAQWVRTSGPESAQVYCVEKIGNEIWTGTGGGLFTSADEGYTWHLSGLVNIEEAVASFSVLPQGEIFMVISYYDVNFQQNMLKAKHSTDGGITWAEDIDMPFLQGNAASVHFSRSNSGKLYVEGQYNVYVLNNNGINWDIVEIPDSLPVIDWAVSDDKIMAVTEHFLFSSLDGGASWSITSIANLAINSVFLDGDLVIFGNCNGHSIRVSNDFYATWTDITQPEVTPRSLFRGADNNLFAYGVGLVKSTDNGLTWTSLIPAGVFYETALDVIQNGDEFIIGTQQGVYTTTGNGATWTLSNTGLTADKTLQVVADQHQWLYAVDFNHLYRSKNQGDSWEKLPIPSYLHPTQILTVGDSIILASKFSSMVMKSRDNGATWTDMNVPDFGSPESVEWHNGTLFVGSRTALYTTNDWGANWKTLGTENEFIASGNSIDDIQFIDDQIFIILNDSKVLSSPDLGTTWSLRHDWATPGANNANKLFYFNNRLFAFGRLQSWYSDDQGVTWNTLANNGIPLNEWDAPAQLVDMVSTDNALFGSFRRSGVYRSDDAGQSWTPVNAGLDNLKGTALALADGQIFLSTSGSSVWRTSLQSVSASAEPAPMNNQLLIYPNPASQQVWITNFDEKFFHGKGVVNMTGMNGKTVFSQSVDLQMSTLQVDLPELPGGFYTVEIRSNGAVMSSGLLVVKSR